MKSIKPKEKTLRTYETFKISPFTITGVERIKKLAQEGPVSLVETDTGVHGTYQRDPKPVTIPVDIRPYRKVFVEGLSSLAKLSPSGLKMLCYLLINLPRQRNEVTIDFDDCLVFCGYEKSSLKSYYRGISDLLEHGFIARKVGSELTFFINTDFIFNGDRKKITP